MLNLDNYTIHYRTTGEPISPNSYRITKWENDRIVESYFSSLKEYKTTKYFYASDELLHLIKTKSTHQFEEGDFQWIPAQEIDLTTIDLSRILYFNPLNQLFFPIEKTVPLTKVYWFISEISSSYYNLSAAEKHLRKHPWVLSLSREKVIDYSYDDEEDHHKQALTLTILPTQEYVDELWPQLAAVDEYPSVRLKESFLPHYQYRLRTDPLNLAPFLKPQDDDDAHC